MLGGSEGLTASPLRLALAAMRRGPHLECSDLIHLLQCEPDVVEPVEQAVLAEGVHFEGEGGAVLADDRLRGQVDLQLVARIGVGHELHDLRRGGGRGDGWVSAAWRACVCVGRAVCVRARCKRGQGRGRFRMRDQTLAPPETGLVAAAASPLGYGLPKPSQDQDFLQVFVLQLADSWRSQAPPRRHARRRQ